FGVPRVGLTATVAAPQEEVESDGDVAASDSSEVAATATAVMENSIALESVATTEDQVLGGVTGGAAPEDDAGSAAAEEQAAGSTMMMQTDATTEDEAEAPVMPDASSAPSLPLPAPETVLQTVLRWLLFLLQSLGN
ncbi:MAG: hypothetical protein KC496_19650, partial [Anaerolineae bacterium]|nr:hypothetical protein [Anaerolineae bacterium]